MRRDGYIPTTPPLPSMDFNGLLKAGLAACQQLGGAVWTDYNEHDPGVTILEQLCYAITDLGYRSSYAVADILAEYPGHNQAGYTTLFTGDQVLSCAALSATDYRKLILGAARSDPHLANIKNAWVRPYQVANDAIGGQIEIAIELFDYGLGTPACQDALQACQDALRTLYMANRTLGEDLHGGIVVLETCPVEVGATIEIGAGCDAEQTLVDMLFALQQMLVPFVQFDTVASMLKENLPFDKIYAGPLVPGGVIDDATLAPLRTSVSVFEVRNTLLVVDGVLAVSELQVTVDNQPLPAGARKLNGAVPRLAPSIFDTGADPSKLVVQRQGMPLPLDWAKVEFLMALRIGKLLVRNDFGVPGDRELAYCTLAPGRQRHIARYQSIQRQFPAIYGIGADGIEQNPNAPEPGIVAPGPGPGTAQLRLAQARQLKAYLLFFEQLLVDSGAQLANAALLFSLDPNVNQSYYWGSLVDADGPPNIIELLRDADAPEPPPPPEPPGDCYYVVHFKEPAQPELLLRGVELRSNAEALFAEGEIIELGKRSENYRVHRLGSRDLYQLVLESGDPVRRIAFGGQRFGSAEEARDLVATLVMLMWALEADPALRTRCVSIKCRGTRSIRLRGDNGEVYLAARGLTARGQNDWVEQLLRCGINAGNYRVEAAYGGSFRILLLCSRLAVLAEGEQEFGTREQAREGIDLIVALVLTLCCNPVAQVLHVERLPHGAPPLPVPSPDADPRVATYLKGLGKLVRRSDPWHARRNLFLDHLLARFGERYDTDALRLAAAGVDQWQLEKQLIAAKIAFLQRFVHPVAAPIDGLPPYGLGGGRSWGGTPAAPFRSALAQRLALLLGFVDGGEAYAGNVYTVEHVQLSRSDVFPNWELKRMFCSWRISVICVIERDKVDREAFMALANTLVDENCPVHLLADCHVLWADEATSLLATLDAGLTDATALQLWLDLSALAGGAP